jgi:hypothetical protein
MKITHTVLSIPPYLSTTWKSIFSLHVQGEGNAQVLIITLLNKTEIEIPHLSSQEIHSIFEAHARHSKEETPLDGPFSFSIPIKGDGPIDSLGMSMQHNPEQSDLPPMEPAVLKKITLIAQAFGLNNSSLLPPPEPLCNCVYCQVTRALSGEESPEELEEVTAEDLTFRNWDIAESAHHLYKVTNPLDPNEHYSVFLGEPIGCTCGSKNCEHIRAVLNT